MNSSMIHFAATCVGSVYGDHYINNLYRGIEHHYSGKCDFTLITDRMTRDIHAGSIPSRKVEDLILPKNEWHQKNWGWFSKLNYFRTDIWPAGDKVIAIDLDSIITNDLTPLASVRGFGMIDWKAKANPFGSGVMVLAAGDNPELYADFDIRQRDRWKKGDQAYIAAKMAGKITSIGPDLVSSWKRHKKHGAVEPQGECIVAMHGKPKPHELPRDGWAYKAWQNDQEHLPRK